MRRSFPGFLLFLSLLLPFASNLSFSQEIPPAPLRWATDKAGFLRAETIRALDAELESFEQRTGHQFIVYIDRTIGIEPLEDWAARVFQAWEVGRRGEDDGLALFIMSEDRKIRIEVGYGLEGIVPDVTASRIIQEILVPSFQDGDPDSGVREAVDKLISVMEGEQGEEETDDSVGFFDILIFGILGLVFLYILITNPALALRFLFIIMSGGGGGGSSGGGFRGGGGRSGGGGASGSW